jgi:hypothetical protein
MVKVVARPGWEEWVELACIRESLRVGYELCTMNDATRLIVGGIPGGEFQLVNSGVRHKELLIVQTIAHLVISGIHFQAGRFR